MKIKEYIDSLPPITNRKIIITGGNSGLGFSIASHSLSKGARIVLACRNIDKANKAKDNLLKLYPGSDISIMIYDQASLKSCKEFARAVIRDHSDFYCLVLNAGVFRIKKGIVTEDGFPMVSGVNAFGTLAIVEELQGYLNEVEREKRIVIQGSLGSRLEKMKDFEYSLQNPYIPYFTQYFNSKNMCLNIFEYYGRHNNNPCVKYLQCEPGISSSNIIQNFPKAIKPVCNFFLKLLFQNPDMGSLPAMDVICGNVSNLVHSRPRGLFAIRGFPKRFRVKQKHIHFDMLLKMIEIVKKH